MSALFSRRPWGRNECVTNEPQQTFAGRLVNKENSKNLQLLLNNIKEENKKKLGKINKIKLHLFLKNIIKEN